MGLLQDKLAKYDEPQKYMAEGIYPYFREIEGKQGTEVLMGGHRVLMFGSNAYTGLTGDDRVIEAGVAVSMVPVVPVHDSSTEHWTYTFNLKKNWQLL